MALQDPLALDKAAISVIYKFLRMLSEILTGIELPCEAIVGRRFRIDHFGGIIISGDAVFGEDCIVRNGVTVGLGIQANVVHRSLETVSTLEQERSFWGRFG